LLRAGSASVAVRSSILFRKELFSMMITEIAKRLRRSRVRLNTEIRVARDRRYAPQREMILCN
jgi:hypothetical protein